MLPPKKIDFINSCKNSMHKNAIVTFDDNSQAMKALQMYSYATINNFIQIHFFAADNETKKFLKRKHTTIYFYTKGSSVNSQFLQLKMEGFGKIENFHYNAEKAIGTATFLYTEDAIKAKNELEQMSLYGFHIKVSLTSMTINHSKNENGFSSFLEKVKNSDNKLILKEGNDSSIFVLDIPTNANQSFLFDVFDNKSIDIKLKKRKENEKSRPLLYALVTFKNHEDAVSAFNDYNFTKLDGIPFHIDFADTETRKLLATNKGKVFISNIPNDIDISQMFDAMSNFGEIIDIEMPIKVDKIENYGYCYVQFRNTEDAKTAVNSLKDAQINGQNFFIKMVDEDDKNVPFKEFLFKYSKQSFKKVTCHNIKAEDMLCFDLSLLNGKSEPFYFSIDNDRKIESTKLIASFLSPKITQNIKSNKNLSVFSIKVKSLNSISANNIQLIKYLSTLYKKNLIKETLKTQFFKITQQIISSIKEDKFKEFLTKKVKECYEYLYKISENIQNNNEILLNFLLLIEIFTQFDNKYTVDFCINLFIRYIISNQKIKNIQVCFTSLQMKRILNFENQEIELISKDQEINFLSKNFIELDPMILNKIDAETIEKVIYKCEVFIQDEDKFLYQILHFDDDYKKYFINFVEFTKISNKAMKFFLNSIDFSFIDDRILATISTRLRLPFCCKIEDTNPQQKENVGQSQFIQTMVDCFQNSIYLLSSNENNLFIIFVNDKYIEINKNIAIIVSPIIKKNLEADVTISSFYIKLNSQIEYFKEYYQSLAYFLQQEVIINQEEIENKFYDQIKYLFNLIEKEGIHKFVDYILKFPSNTKNSLDYAIMISIFLNIGNFKIVEYLVNSFVKSNEKEIGDHKDLYQRLKHKKILKFNDEIRIDESKERAAIATNFINIFSNINSFSDIDEIIWRVISIRLSFDIVQKCYNNETPNMPFNPPQNMPFIPSNMPFIPSNMPFNPSNMPFIPSNYPFITPPNMPFIPSNYPFNPSNMPFNPSNMPFNPPPNMPFNPPPNMPFNPPPNMPFNPFPNMPFDHSNDQFQ